VLEDQRRSLHGLIVVHCLLGKTEKVAVVEPQPRFL
jgi:hypothetical protein